MSRPGRRIDDSTAVATFIGRLAIDPHPLNPSARHLRNLS
jgi:hypothetical protein